MKKTIRSIFSGLLLLALAAWLIVCVITKSRFFFTGWWTLFLIIPAIYGIINDGFNFFNTILLLIGGLLLSRFYIPGFEGFDFKYIIYIALACLLVALALRILFAPVITERKRKRIANAIPGSSDGSTAYNVKFSSKNIKFEGNEFNGATLDVNFGSITLDLTKAVIEHDVDIFVNVSFGGVEILLPENVGIDDKTSSNFGGVNISQRAKGVDKAYPKVVISGECSFSGIDVK